MTQVGEPRPQRFPTERSFQIYRRFVLDGELETEIARELQVKTRQVQDEIARVERWLADGAGGDVDRIRMRHTFRLEAIYHRALEEFDRSRQDAVTSKRTVEGNKRGETAGHNGDRSGVRDPKVKIETVTAPRGGETKYLAEARAALADIRKVWGIEVSPKGAGASADDDAAWEAIDLSALSDAEVQVLGAADRLCERLVEGGGVLPPPNA